MKPIMMPGYRINEYHLVLLPHEELRNRIRKVKEEFAERFRVPVGRSGRAHITLVRFQSWEMTEEKLLHRLQSIAMGIAPFKVELKDYGSFPAHTLFIQVPTKIPVQHLVSELRDIQRLVKGGENKPHFITEPYIPIAQQLKPWQYEQGWLEYAHRHFTGRFIAGSMLLLKRTAGEKAMFQIAGRFDFQNLPVSTKQGNLFV